MILRAGRRDLNLLLGLVLISWLVLPILVGFSRIDVDYSSFYPLLIIPAICFLCAPYCYFRKMKFFGETFEVVGANFLLVVPILISTYLAMALDQPLADVELIAMDKALGFNWHAFIAFVDGSRFLSSILQFSYTSFGLQLLIIPIILTMSNDLKRAVAFVFGYGILCYISSVISIWYPALGTYMVYDVSKSDLSNINAHFGFFFLSDFYAARSGDAFTLVMGKASGIITFPSVHAGIAFLAIWAMWESKWFRYPFLVLNILMATSAVSHANHYLIDIIAGGGIAGLVCSILAYVFLGHRWVGFNITKPSKLITKVH